MADSEKDLIDEGLRNISDPLLKVSCQFLQLGIQDQGIFA